MSYCLDWLLWSGCPSRYLFWALDEVSFINLLCIWNCIRRFLITSLCLLSVSSPVVERFSSRVSGSSGNNIEPMEEDSWGVMRSSKYNCLLWWFREIWIQLSSILLQALAFLFPGCEWRLQPLFFSHFSADVYNSVADFIRWCWWLALKT